MAPRNRASGCFDLANQWKGYFSNRVDPGALAQIWDPASRKLDHISFTVKYALEQVCLELNTGQDSFFNTVFGNKIHHVDAVALLADTADPSDPLIETGRVPGQFKVDHTVGGLEVQAGAACIG